MKKRSTLFRTLRLAVLFTLLGLAALLYLWNRNIDPRFYRFLETRPGAGLARVMGWDHTFNLPPLDLPESEMTEEELAIKRELEARVLAEQPTHELTLRTGQTLRGSLVSETAHAVTFREQYGAAGELAVTIRRERVQQIVPLDLPIPRVYYRDVLFQKEFPSFVLYRRPPYTIVTDESFFRVEHSIRILERMHRDFLYLFEPVIVQPERGENIQVLFFSDENAYSRYQRAHAPRMESSSGFYSPQLDRLVIFNQISSAQLREARERMDLQERAFRRTATDPEALEALAAWRRDTERNLQRYAEEQTQFTLRHEGAHQLFFTYGVHSTHQAENTWLVEGLAVFCEASRVGLREPDRVSTVKGHARDETLIPLAELLASRSPRGFFVYGGAERVSLAYAQSWSIVHFLMQPQYREGFFDFIRFVRDPANVQAVATRPQIELLAEFLSMSPESFERLWREYIMIRL